MQSFQGDDGKMGVEMGFSNSTGLSNEELNAAADAAQPMTTNLHHSDYPSQDLEDGKKDESDADIFGIKGLLGIIKTDNSDKSKLALGVDLTTLGLNMNQPEYPLPPEPAANYFTFSFYCGE